MTLIFISIQVRFISIKPVLSDHLPFVTIFHWSLGRSHMAGLTTPSFYNDLRPCGKVGNTVFSVPSSQISSLHVIFTFFSNRAQVDMQSIV